MSPAPFGSKRSLPTPAAPAPPEVVRPTAAAEAAAVAEEAASAAMHAQKNKRKSPRRRVLKEGKLIFGQAQLVVDCTIDNMSDEGAHIRLNSSHGLPEDFFLVEAARGVIHRAEVAWRTTTGMGLRLLGPLEDTAARAAFMRKFKRS